MRIAIVFRPVPALKGAEAGIAKGLRAAGHDVVADREGFDSSVDAVLIPNMPTGYPRALAQLRSLGPRRPRVVVWMTEPLVPPRASGLPWPRRTHRDWIKLALRDRRVIDARSNERRTVALVRVGLIDAVVEAETADLAAVLTRWLADADGREGMISAAYETVTTRLERARSVATLSALLAGGSVAPAR